MFVVMSFPRPCASIPQLHPARAPSQCIDHIMPLFPFYKPFSSLCFASRLASCPVTTLILCPLASVIMYSPALPWLSPVLLGLLNFAHAQGSPQLCPNMNNTMYTESNGNTYTILCGFDTQPGAFGGTTGTTTGVSLNDCIIQCDALANCYTVTFASPNTCYLKPAMTAMTQNSNLQSASRYIPPPAYPPPQANYVNASSGCGTPLGAGITAGGKSTNVSFATADGRIRSYFIHVPSGYDPNKAAPLIMSFHGKGSTATAHEAETGFSTTWNPYGTAVYPQGINVRPLDFSMHCRLSDSP